MERGAGFPELTHEARRAPAPLRPASLALQLLGSRPHLVWYLPSLSDTSATDSGSQSFFDLLPSGWLWGTLQLFIAAGVAALWRARRLGPLVPEKL
ncbi:MAG: hypothetical protein JWO46_623, partial [Nocardioidaceae bacterium]|nr:hypothetical protein [Nocardioidaceae bacterium]